MDEQLPDTFTEPLTPREMDVLVLLAEGLSNQEIAEALVFEVGTVKWYNTQIYGKLQVKNRREAITRARTLGILEADTADPLQRLQHNLPADTLPFIGRASEIDDLVQQMTSETIRLITILGPGGMGKTRLSIEVGRRLLGYFLDGVYFVPLASVNSSEHIVTMIAEIIGFNFRSDMQPKQQLAAYLQKQHMLLIIDNFEHLLDHAGLLTDILNVASNVKMLATSREKLGLGGEVVYVISGLSIPYEENTEVIDHDAVKLFIEAANRTGTSVTEHDISVLATICQMLGGMPLGILLAAAWLDTLTLSEIEAEIRSGLGILETTVRDAPQRHQSIEAVFDYSWKRLTANEQTVFMRLSVFRDGFTREAAQEVTGASIRDLQRLVHTSFLQHLPSGRYMIHELLRQYGEQKLVALGELENLREKHAHFFAEFIMPLGETVWRQADLVMLEAVNIDFENVRAAWNFHAERGNSNGLQQLLGGIWYFLDAYSRSQEAIDLFEVVYDTLGDNEIRFRGQIAALLGWFYGDIGLKAKALELSERAVAILQRFPTTNFLLQAHAGLAIMLHFTNKQQDAIEVLEKAIGLSHESGDKLWQPVICSLLGGHFASLGRHEEALSLLQQSGEYHISLGVTGHILMQLGENARAEEILFEALSLSGRHRYGTMRIYTILIENAVLSGQYEKASLYLQRSLQYADDISYAWAALEILEGALGLFVAEDQVTMAVELLSLITHHPQTTDLTRAQIAKHENTLKTRLPSVAFDAAWERGQHIDLGDLITELIER